MAYSTITKPSLQFNTKLYSGNGSTQSITGVGFRPDWIWQKERDGTSYHVVTDIVRGNTKQLFPNDTSANVTSSNYITSFDSDGFGLGQNNDTNESGKTYVSWNWKAGNSAGSSNSDGSITSTVSLNTAAGFSIVKYTGTGSGATVGHGLGSALSWLLVKKIESGGQAGNWTIWHKGTTQPAHDEVLFLNNNSAEGDVSNDTYWNGANPTSSVFSINTNENLNENTYDYIAYCFTEKKGFSKMHKYTGNGNSDGVFVYTGFKPAFVICKRINAAENWPMFDNRLRPSNNVGNNFMYADLSNVQDSSGGIDFLSNGFKLRTASNLLNGGGAKYIYIAFADEPLVANVGSSIPATAR
jgi:hypothetical protein